MNIYDTYRDCTRIFYLDTLHSTLSSIIINDDQSGMDSIEYHIAYSLDNAMWFDWVEIADVQLLIDELHTYIGEIDIHIRLRVKVVKDARVQTHAFYSLKDILVDNEPVNVINIAILEDSKILINDRSKNLFNPYRVSEQQKKLYDKLSRSVSDIFSFECMYFRVQPDIAKQDVTFKTYTMNNVVEQKTLQIVIKNNELPHDKLLFTDFDIDFQDELEIHIVKEVFEEVFGVGEEPNARDFMFLPLTNRMYEVNVTANGDLFFNHAPFWKAFLVKYENRASIAQSDEVFDELDELLDYSHEYEEELYAEEKADAVNSYNDISLDSKDNISDSKLNIDDLEVFKYAFNYESILNTDIAKSYTFASSSNEFGIAIWINHNAVGNILSMHDENDAIVYALSNSIDSINATIYDALNNQLTISTTQTTIDPELHLDSWIGIVANYVNNDIQQRMTISVYNNKLELIHEIAEMNIFDIAISTKLNIYGSFSFANVRLSKTFITKTEAKQVLSTMITSTGRFSVIDNATPAIISQ